MSVDIENIKGVFADLDDGGLTDSEAIDQIRSLLGVRPVPKRVLLTYLIPVNVVVNVEEDAIESAELDLNEMWGIAPGAAPMDGDGERDLNLDDQGERLAAEKAQILADNNNFAHLITVLGG